MGSLLTLRRAANRLYAAAKDLRASGMDNLAGDVEIAAMHVADEINTRRQS